MKQLFSAVLLEHFGTVPLLEAEKDHLKAEYTTLLLNAQDAPTHYNTQSHQRLPLRSYGIPSSLGKDITNTACLSTILPCASLPLRFYQTQSIMCLVWWIGF